MTKKTKKQKWAIGMSATLASLLIISGGVVVYFALQPSVNNSNNPTPIEPVPPAPVQPEPIQPLPPTPIQPKPETPNNQPEAQSDAHSGQTSNNETNSSDNHSSTDNPTPDHKPDDNIVPSQPDNNNQVKPTPTPLPNISPNEKLDPNLSLHSLPLTLMLQAQSPLEIIQSTTLFKVAVQRMEKALTSFDWNNNGNQTSFDGMYYTWGGFDKVYQNFFDLNQEVGIFGEYGHNQYEKMRYSPKKIMVGYDMQQKYLNQSDFSVQSQAIDYPINLDAIIQANQFGYLPSNLSQFLYYVDYAGLQTIFNLDTPIIGIQMDFDDYLGSGDIYLTLQTNQVYHVHLDTHNSYLKCENDFKNYIFERSFVFHTPTFYQTSVYVDPFGKGNSQVKISPEAKQGTAWILDRIVNPELEQQGQYEFLVGTNMHVLDMSEAFNKDRHLATGASQWDTQTPTWKPNVLERTYDQFWDGGFKSQKTLWNDISDGPIVTMPSEPKKYTKHDVIKERKPDGKSYYTITKSVHDNVLDAQQDTQEQNFQNSPINFDNTNYLDLVWYTPSFTTTGSYTSKDSASSYPVFDPSNQANETNNLQTGLESYNGCHVGKISNAGADFAITKIILTKHQIETMFPSLNKVLNTPKEVDWYIGLGPQNHAATVSANSTLFIGGYPNNSWQAIKSSSGKIQTQPRYIPNERNTYQTYWTKYDAVLNQEANTYRGLVDWYAQHQAHSPSMDVTQNQTYLPKGMQIKKILLQSFITYDQDGTNNSEQAWLAHGSSGSMIINSRFELVGVHDKLYLYNQPNSDQIDPNSHYNSGLLINNYTQENHNQFSIIDQVIQKLQSEQTHTLKLNPLKP